MFSLTYRTLRDFFMYTVGFYVFILHCSTSDTLNPSRTTSPPLDATDAEKSMLIFRTLFNRNRAEQISAAKRILTLKYEHQYDMLSMMFEKIFEAIIPSKVTVENSGYIPGDGLPVNHTVRDALYQLLDNTALYSEFQLKFPDITDRIMEDHNEWLVHIKWAIGFSNSTEIFDTKTTELMNLVAQEMNLIERSPFYTNPYRMNLTNFAGSSHDVKTAKKKKNFPKGPRLSKPRHVEL